MGFEFETVDVTPMVINTNTEYASIVRVPNFRGDTPHGPVVHEIMENMTCGQMLNYAHYIFYRRSSLVYFGGHQKTVEQVCQMFPDVLARSFAVRAEVGPPNRRAWRTVTLAQLMVDWYWTAKVAKNRYLLDRFQAALANRGVVCKI